MPQEQERERPTRRNAIRRGLLAAGGLVGIGAAAKAAGGSIPAARGRSRAVTLVAPDLGAHGVQDASSAERFDLVAASGRPAGEVHVATAPVLGPGASSPGAGAMEWHTFHLPGGTILGAGSAGTATGSFAVVGGTGRYAGARGTYDLRRLAGGGTEFVLRIES